MTQRLSDVLWSQSRIYRQAAGFSFITSLLSLAPTVYMLVVYDRVVTSRSITTLLMVLLCVIGVYVLMEVLETVRSRLLQVAGLRIDEILREPIHDAAFRHSLNYGVSTTQPFTDLRTLREFISSPVVSACFDVPSSLIFLVFVFVLSPILGVTALIGLAVQFGIGVLTEKKTMPTLTAANQSAIAAQNYASGVLRNTEVIHAMGMQGNLAQRWLALQRKFLSMQAIASDTAGSNTATSKFIQMLQGSLMLAVSCWLTLKGMLLGGGGMMIVASVLGSRVLQPLVTMVSMWRQVVNARDAHKRLDGFLGDITAPAKKMPLMKPVGKLSVEGVIASAPQTRQPIIRGVSFQLNPGENLLIIGPSAAGKTTLARLLMGVWPTDSGKVRLDGADIHAWDKAELGPHIGYLPQSVELFDGTLAENIARFSDIDLEKVRTAIDSVGLTDLVKGLPQGLDTRIGEEGAFLSGGQRQRVGLARAIYGEPNFVLLDEPNSSLDDAGEQALMNTLQLLKQRACTTIVISHRSSVLPAADKILLMRDGQVAAFGPRDEVLEALRKPRAVSGGRADDAPQLARGGAA